MFAFVAIAALVSCSVAQPWYGAGYCADVNTACSSPTWSIGCSYNEEVRRQCPATCGLCSDYGYYNGYYDSRTYNYGYPSYYAPVAAVAECRDAIDECASYVSAGWCEHERASGKNGYVSTNCARSCGLCIYKK